ncbi:MAG: PLDc N-terminal domain-containing protein [Anaerolineae bacterium]|jgi:hypothetical protein|nr:PLDc N-terminal domain-containing protein [Anaerolineae bacterium]
MTWAVIAQSVTILFMIAYFALIGMALAHLLRQTLPNETRLLWGLVIVFCPLLGALLALAVLPKRKRA